MNNKHPLKCPECKRDLTGKYGMTAGKMFWDKKSGLCHSDNPTFEIDDVFCPICSWSLAHTLGVDYVTESDVEDYFTKGPSTKVKLAFEFEGKERSEIIELYSSDLDRAAKLGQNIETYVSNNHLIEFVFDCVDARAEVIKDEEKGKDGDD